MTIDCTKWLATQQKQIQDKYGISIIQAGCYLSNHGTDEYICERYNGGCKFRENCLQINKKEKER